MACVTNLHPHHKFYDRFFQFASSVTNVHLHSKFSDRQCHLLYMWLVTYLGRLLAITLQEKLGVSVPFQKLVVMEMENMLCFISLESEGGATPDY